MSSQHRKSAKPANAYELLLLVADHIEEEPRRYHQGAWFLHGDAIDGWMPAGRPPCGTVCCRAGWIVALHDGADALKSEALVATRADEILGMAPEFLYENLFSALLVSGIPGTTEYATAGADGLRAFANEHREHLTARVLADIPPLEQS